MFLIHSPSTFGTFQGFSILELSRENSAFVSTRVDWKEIPKAHLFKVEIPGLKKEEVKVEIASFQVFLTSKFGNPYRASKFVKEKQMND
ncbi:HSP20-like chaperone [Sesbania bispinosa]|nr:HSP20-like chaperone [Sesbania bispinosa]